MAICDSLCEAKELALSQVNPQLFTIATLTGHVIRTYGENYSSIMSNGPARVLHKIDHSLQELGHDIGDPYEISTIRREDYKNHKG
jgi:leucyl aminopeptidase